MSKRTQKSRLLTQNSAPRSWWKKYGVVLGSVVLLVSLGVVLALGGRSGSASPASEVSLDKSKGEASATVTVEEYGDFQCPACQRFFESTESQLKDEYVSKGQVRFVFRHMAFIGNESRWAAEASECANEQGRFWDYHDTLYKRQGGENVGVFSKENLQRFAVDLGLDTAQFNQCLTSGKYAAKVQQETATGEQKGVRGTPTVLVNGQLVERGADYRVLRSAIEAALNR